MVGSRELAIIGLTPAEITRQPFFVPSFVRATIQAVRLDEVSLMTRERCGFSAIRAQLLHVKVSHSMSSFHKQLSLIVDQFRLQLRAVIPELNVFPELLDERSLHCDNSRLVVYDFALQRGLMPGGI
jgi:hypothetical protein